MSAPGANAGGWTRRRWAWIIGGGLAAHVLLVVWLGERAKPPGVVVAPDPLLKLVVDPNSIRCLAASPLLSDPTLFALPSARGFSGGAWLQFSPIAPPQSGWTEPPRWLPLDTNELGAVFSRFAATNKYAGSVIETLLQPRVTTADILVLNDPLMTQSVVRVEGPLARRPLAAPITAPNPACAEVLRETRVQIRANRDGITETVMLLEGCGVNSVDDQALAIARTARFQPAPPTGPDTAAGESASWGQLVFQWFTVPNAN